MGEGQLAVLSVSKLIRNQTEDIIFTVSEVNGHCLGPTVINREFNWHTHESCDELFYVIEGELFIALSRWVRHFRVKYFTVNSICIGFSHPKLLEFWSSANRFFSEGIYTAVIPIDGAQ